MFGPASDKRPGFFLSAPRMDAHLRVAKSRVEMAAVEISYADSEPGFVHGP